MTRAVPAVTQLLAGAGKGFRDALFDDVVTLQRVPFGIARGTVQAVNLRHQFRQALGLYELEIADVLRNLASNRSVCLDVGAATGYYSLAFARLNPSGRVVAFEPDVACRRAFSAALRHNAELADRIMVIPCAVSDHDDRNAGLATIDCLVAEGTFPAPSFVKMDIEGAEVAALRGMRTVLTNQRPALLIEVHGLDRELGCVEILKEHDYAVRTIDQANFIPEHRPLAHNRWLFGLPRPS